MSELISHGTRSIPVLYTPPPVKKKRGRRISKAMHARNRLPVHSPPRLKTKADITDLGYRALPRSVWYLGRQVEVSPSGFSTAGQKTRAYPIENNADMIPYREEREFVVVACCRDTSRPSGSTTAKTERYKRSKPQKQSNSFQTSTTLKAGPQRECSQESQSKSI